MPVIKLLVSFSRPYFRRAVTDLEFIRRGGGGVGGMYVVAQPESEHQNRSSLSNIPQFYI